MPEYNCRLRIKVGWKHPMPDEWKAPPDASSFLMSVEIIKRNKWMSLPYEEETVMDRYFTLPFVPTKDILLHSKRAFCEPVRILDVAFNRDLELFELSTHDWTLDSPEDYKNALQQLRKRTWDTVHCQAKPSGAK